jgi:hypothetical protein
MEPTILLGVYTRTLALASSHAHLASVHSYLGLQPGNTLRSTPNTAVLSVPGDWSFVATLCSPVSSWAAPSKLCRPQTPDSIHYNTGEQGECRTPLVCSLFFVLPCHLIYLSLSTRLSPSRNLGFHIHLLPQDPPQCWADTKQGEKFLLKVIIGGLMGFLVS